MAAENADLDSDVKLVLHKGRVRAALKSIGCNQKTFAAAGHVSETTLSQAMNGNCSAQTLGIIAAAVKVDPVHLLTDECRAALESKLNPGSPQPPPSVPTLTAVADFTGRTKELAEIAEHLLSGLAVCITAIKAAGGMGKTELARKSAADLTAHFSDGTLLLELDGVTTPKPPVAVMQELIRKCIPGTGQLPDTVELLRGPYLAALGGKKLLLVLDNAADAGQVGPLLRDLPPTVGVIVTSRKLISLPAVKRIDLEVMSDVDAVALLGGIVTPTRGDLTTDDLTAVAGLCGHLPLALRVAGTLLRDDKKWTRARFAKALADDPLRHLTLGTDEYDVGAVLRLSVLQLVRHNAEQAERFQMLGVFPGTFALAAAAAVWSLDEDETFTDLDELHHRSLIEWDEKADRFRLHDLMRPVARDAFPSGHVLQAGGDERIALAERRFAEHYAKVLGAANGGLLTVGLATYDLEVTNIAAGRVWAEAHAATGTDAAVHFLFYSLYGAQLYLYRLPPAERVALYERSLSMSLHLKDRESEANAKFHLGEALVTLGDVERSLTLYREAADLHQRRGDMRSKAVAMGKIADILAQRGQTDEALRIRREDELPVYERLGDVRSKTVTMGQIADILQDRGQTDEALRIRREEQLSIYERLGDERSKAVVMGKIADILQDRGQTDEALHIRREEELPVYERLGDMRAKAMTMAKIAGILWYRGQTDEALSNLEAIKVIFHELGDVRSKAVTMGRIADILAQRGQTDEALRIRREDELPVYERLGDVREKVICRAKIGVALIQKPVQTTAEADEVREHLLWALATAEKHQYAEAAQLRQMVAQWFGPSEP